MRIRDEEDIFWSVFRRRHSVPPKHGPTQKSPPISTSFWHIHRFARYCVHNEKSWCRGHNIWGWCFHNKKTPQQNSSDDPYCYSLLTAEEDGGPTTVTRGCHSRKMVMHFMSKNEDDQFQNNTKWRETKRMAEMPSCSEILKDQPKVNGTRSLCIDYTFDQDPEEGEDATEEPIRMKGRLCCCDGTNKCNEQAMWADEGISLDELKEEIEKRKVAVGGVPNYDGFLVSTLLVFVAMAF
ncbi:Protein CBR-MTD-1 [Caenorhabditis briggsae]|uniref:Protein CBR-MTD-1 n=1 Tax=Caenorhabditis briggsae TaxID=6238 RepID=A8XWE0_CAEBR|nr:Protein CBR-MTD-1 [Caenorhabditis briggsae]CAP36959.2 Protein CBR-MTD-1 [Caenorhabditis briggsae]